MPISGFKTLQSKVVETLPTEDQIFILVDDVVPTTVVLDRATDAEVFDYALSEMKNGDTIFVGGFAHYDGEAYMLGAEEFELLR